MIYNSLWKYVENRILDVLGIFPLLDILGLGHFVPLDVLGLGHFGVVPIIWQRGEMNEQAPSARQSNQSPTRAVRYWKFQNFFTLLFCYKNEFKMYKLI